MISCTAIIGSLYLLFIAPVLLVGIYLYKTSKKEPPRPAYVPTQGVKRPIQKKRPSVQTEEQLYEKELREQKDREHH